MERQYSFQAWLIPVLSAHILMIMLLAFSLPAKTLPMPKKVKVTTIKLNSKTPEKAAVPNQVKTAEIPKAQPEKKPESIQNPPKEKPVAAPKSTTPKTTPKKPAAKKVTPKKPAVAKKEESPVKTVSQTSDQTAKKQAALNKLKTVKTVASSGSKETLSTIQITEPIGVEGVELNLYQSLLVSKLKTELKLPEPGAIELKLTLKKDGQVKELKIVRASSPKNEEYVRRQLPKIRFASFGNEFGKSLEHTFDLELTHSR